MHDSEEERDEEEKKKQRQKSLVDFARFSGGKRWMIVRERKMNRRGGAGG